MNRNLNKELLNLEKFSLFKYRTDENIDHRLNPNIPKAIDEVWEKLQKENEKAIKISNNKDWKWDWESKKNLVFILINHY